MKLSDFNLLDDQNDDNELSKILDSFNDTGAKYPKKTIVQLFEEQVDKNPKSTALVFNDIEISYEQLDKQANRYANFLINNGVKKGDIVGLLFNKSPKMIYAILGIVKAGAVYLPMDPNYPIDRLKFTIDDSKAGIILGQKEAIKVMNKLQWECKNLKSVVCVDTPDFYSEEEPLNEMMKKELWDYIGDKSHDDISGGGWFSSYTGEDLSREEMDEYGDNVFKKLEPHLTPETKVLEIGCSSGISMFRIAPKVKSYYGIDLSSSLIEKTTKEVEKRGLKNITLENLPAHEVDKISDKDFDVVIINSVIQLFNGHNYLRGVLNKSMKLMGDKGVLFLGDLQDQDRKEDLVNSLKDFQKEHFDKGYKTKIDWSNELFISKDFLSDLQYEVDGIKGLEFSEKIHTIKNELTEFRFDALLQIDKSISRKTDDGKHKTQLGRTLLLESSEDRPDTKITPQDTLYIIYTSGSTGRPKGCKISHENVVRLMINDKHDFDFSEKDVWIMAHAYYFDFSVWEMYGPLLYGGKLVIPTQNDVKDVSKLHGLVRKHKVSVLNQTPLAFNFFIDEEIQAEAHELDKHLRYVIFGGDKLDPQKFIPWVEYYGLDKIKLINMYGITETTVHVTYYQITQKDIDNKGVSPIGRPLPETKVFVLNENMKPQPIGIAGEMYVGGTGVCQGYLNRDELTKERFIQSPFDPNERLYKTGDQAKWTEDGNLEYQGRIDFQVKIRGYRIELGEVESHVNAHPDIKEAVVIAYDNKGSNELVSYVVTDNENLEAKSIREYLRADLPDFMIPAHFVPIDKIPLTVNGKLDKKALPDPYKESLGSSEEYVEPSSESEKVIASVWSELLGVEKVGVNDNFFSIGGDSLKAIKVVVQINKKLDSSIKVGDMFIHQTVAQLAKHIDESDGSGGSRDYEVGMKKIGEIRSYVESFSADELPDKYEDIYPLTSIEKGMIFSSMLRPEEPVYYDQFTYNLEIKSEEVFRKGFQLMIDKHPIMRSRYYMNSFLEPIKVVMNSIELPIEFEDISDKTEEEQEAIIKDYMISDKNARLEFEGDILWHLKAFSLKKDHFYVVWSVHHAILDGWSESTFVAEFANLCAQPDIMEINDIPKLKASYKDYTAINLGRENSETALNFWKNHLVDYSRNKLPFNLSGKKISEDLGMERVGKVFDKELSDGIEQLKNKLGVTYKTVCLAAYAYLMHIITSEKDVVSGVVSNDRPEIEDGDKILGCFLNTIPFRADFEMIKTYEGLIKYFADYLNNVKQHELYLVDIANAVGEKSSSGNPLFDCIFNYTDFHVLEDIQEENEKLKYSAEAANDFDIGDANTMTNTLFDIEVDNTMGMLSIGIKYVQSYFRREDVKYAVGLYENILKTFVENINKELNASDLLSEEDRNWLLYEFNDTVTDYPEDKLMHNLFEDQVKEHGQLPALRQHGKDMTYAELNEAANRVAHLLIERGVKSGDNVGVITARNFHMIEALMGVLKAGGAYVPVDPSYPMDRQEYILSNSNAKVVLVDEDYDIIQSDLSKTYLNLSKRDLSKYESTNPDIVKNTADLAYTIYTSGSTGRPKGVMIEHRSAVNLINWVNKTYHIGTTDRLLFITSMCFDLSVYDIFGILGAGGTVVIATQDEVKDPDVLQKLMIDERITYWDSVPTTMNYLVDMIEMTDKNYRQQDLRLVFMSGDWIPVTLPERINKYFPNAKNISLGGATEGTVWSNYHPIEKVEPNQISIPYGKPLDNNFFYILDDNRNPVPRGVAGELYIGGLGVAIGYANEIEKTEASFFEDPFSKLPNARMYKTGDLGRMMADGNMEFLGRKDFQVKIRGFRVELGEIENQLQKHPDVQRAIVLAKDDGNNSKYLVAYIVLEKDTDNDTIKEHLRKELPDYMIPTVFIRIDKVPITSNGKIDRKALPEPEGYMENQEFEAPKPGLETDIAEIWKGILGLDKVGRKENIFELGAHSLHAGAFVSRLLKKHDLSVKLRDLFSNPTVELMARIIGSDSGKVSTFSNIEPVAKADSYEVSASQRRLWVIDQIEEGKSTEYNLPANYEVEGAFDTVAFEKAIQKVVERHEILRTAIQAIDGEPRQVIDDSYSFNLDVEEASDTEIQTLVSEHSFSPFDLSTAPLFRIKVFKLADDRHVVSFVMHHIISDGWSMGVLMDEVFKFYGGFISNTEVELDALNIQYKDFAHWQNEELKSDAAEGHEAYWMEKMAGDIEPVQLPTIKPRPAVLDNVAEKLDSTINSKTTQAIKEFCVGQGISTFMFLNTALKALIYRYTGQKDIALGSPVAGREHSDLSNQIGFYVNTLVLRDQIEPEQPFSKLIEEVKNTMLDAFEHQVYPYDKLVDDLGLERALNRNPLFDIMVGMQNVEEAKSTDEDHFELVGQDLTLNKLSSGESQSKFDLIFNFFEAEEIYLNLEYRKELYSTTFIQQFWNHYMSLIKEVIENPEVEIRNIHLLSSEEQQELIQFGQSSTIEISADATIHKTFEAQVEKAPDNIALIDKNGQMTYQELNEKVNNYAAALQEKGVKKGDIVACLLPKGFDQVASFLGILKVGGTHLPIDVSNPKDRVDYLLSDSKPTLLITDEQGYDQVTTLSTKEISETTASFKDVEVHEEDAAYIIYTSGSSGKPKGVIVTHKGVLPMALAQKNNFNLDENSNLLQFASPAFDATVGELFGGLLNGAKVTIVDDETRKDPKLFAAFIKEKNVSIALLPPSFITLFGEEDLSSLDILLSGGEAAIPRDAERFSKHMQFVNIYGPTEGTVYACHFMYEPEKEYHVIPIGKMNQNYEGYIIDEHKNLVPKGVAGELCIAGSGVAKGYLNRPELTEKAFVENPFGKGKMYRTGDLVKWDEDGNIVYVGRIDSQVKLRGFRIELGEIENAIREVEGVENVYVTVHEEKDQQVLVAYCVMEEEDKDKIKNTISKFLNEYMIPEVFVFLDKLPVNTSGKVDKKQLPKPNMVSKQEYVAPENDIEENLVSIWQDTLSIERVGTYDRFFELGGNSLKAIQVINKAQEDFGIQLTVKDLFGKDTIKELADVVLEKQLEEFGDEELMDLL